MTENSLTQDERDRLVGMVLGHNLQHVREFLQNRGIPKSGNKEQLEERIYNSLDSHRLVDSELIWLLDTIEGWGNQHIYLYKVTPHYLASLKDSSYVEELINSNGMKEVYNNEKPLFTPVEPTLSGITYDSDYLRLKFVEQRKWLEFISEAKEDSVAPTNVILRRYEEHVARGITSFRINLHTSDAELMIQKLPRGARYAEIKAAYEERLNWIVDWNGLSNVPTDSSICPIEESGEAVRRALDLVTIAGSKTSFTSRARGVDYTEDEVAKRARDALGPEVMGELGNFYWLPNSVLAKRLHTYVYRDRVAVFGECTESEVNYVLSRIRSFGS